MHFKEDAAFVIERKGHAIVVFHARSLEKAKKLCKQAWFTEEINRYRSSGIPLWDGISAFKLRPATANEAFKLNLAHASEIARAEFEGYTFEFLVPIDPDIH
jgi:hypothetical protein